jgi:hypothetical protein
MSELLEQQIRESRPAAPAELRERVRALAAEEPARAPWLDRFRFTWGWRRVALAVPATMLVALLAAGVIGLDRGDRASGNESAAGAAEKTQLETFDADAAGSAPAAPATAGSGEAMRAAPVVGGSEDSAGVAPTPGTLQRFEAELSLKVEDVDALSDATKAAQRIALQHGGSVASLSYEAPAQGVGGAQITLRIPTTRVQSALAELSQLGTILGQRYGIQDLQQQADGLQQQVEDTQRQIARIRTQLENPNLSDESEAVLRSRLANAQQKLAGLREALRTTRAEGSTSTVHLTLTTEEIEAVPVGGGRLEGIKDVLVWEAVAALYVVVVAGPLVLLGLLVWLAVRWARRRETARLLEQN